MKLTIEEAFKKGVEAHKEGKLQEANRLYATVLQEQPEHPHVNHNMGVMAVGTGRVQEALPFFNVAIESDPNVTQFWLSYIDALIKLKRFEDAENVLSQAKEKNNKGEVFEQLERIVAQAYRGQPDFGSGDYELKGESFKDASTGYKKQDPPQDQLKSLVKLYRQGQLHEAITIAAQLLHMFPNSVPLFEILAATHVGLKEFDIAIDFFEKIIKINPDSAVTYSNLGNALREKGENDAAIENFNKALKLRPDFSEAYCNMGNAMREKGNLSLAIENYQKALDIKPDYALAFINNDDIHVQMIDQQKQEISTVTSMNESLKDLLLDSPKYQILQSISCYLSGDYASTRECLQRYEVLRDAGRAASLQKGNKRFCNAYSNLLNILLERRPVSSSSANNKIYHIGESHCLSYGHSSLDIGKETFTIAPVITFGAKAFHFSNAQENQVKSITRHNLSKIPKGSKVFVSVGEIDCRPDEGLILASKKHELPLPELVQKTVVGYVDWFLDANKDNGHTYHIFNLPAPIYNENEDLVINQQVADVVKRFNEELKVTLNNKSIMMIDVYESSRNDDGFSNGQYHCDDYHLDTRMLGQIEAQLN